MTDTTTTDGGTPNDRPPFQRFDREEIFPHGSSAAVAFGGHQSHPSLEHAGIESEQDIEVWGKDGSIRLLVPGNPTPDGEGYHFLGRSSVRNTNAQKVKYLARDTRDATGLERGDEVVISARPGEIDISRD